MRNIEQEQPEVPLPAKQEALQKPLQEVLQEPSESLRTIVSPEAEAKAETEAKASRNALEAVYVDWWKNEIATAGETADSLDELAEIVRAMQKEYQGKEYFGQVIRVLESIQLGLGKPEMRKVLSGKGPHSGRRNALEIVLKDIPAEYGLRSAARKIILRQLEGEDSK